MRRWIMPSGFGAAAAVVTALLTLSSFSRTAHAASVREPVVVVVEGPRASAVEGWLEDGLNAPDTLEEEQTFRGALRARGALPLHLAMTSAARDTRLIACAHAAAGEADVAGALLVDLQRTSSATRIHVWRIDTRPGGAVIERDLTLPLTVSAVEASRAILGSVPAPAAAVTSASAAGPAPAAAPVRAAPPANPTPPEPPISAPPADVESRHAPDSVAREPSGAKDALLSLQAALGIGMRHFSYVDRVTPTLRPYDLAAAPMASIAAVVYPLASTRVPVARDLGIAGDYARTFPLDSQDSTGARYGTTWQSFDVGVTERFSLSRALLANVSLGYGGNDFQFDHAPASAAAALPSVAYRFVRAGGDLRVAVLAALSVSGGGSYMDLLGTGYTSALFPRQSVGGVEGHLGATYAIAKSFELTVGASYARVFYSFNPVPGDANVAGGALDEQTRILAGLSYVM